MAIDVTQSRREELAATIRRNARGLSLLSGAAVVAATLDRDGEPRARVVPAVLAAVLILPLIVREHALADLASVHGEERLEQLRKRLPAHWVVLVIIYASAVVGGLDIWRGHATLFSTALLAACIVGGLLAQLRLRPALNVAWNQLRELDAHAS